MGVDTILSAKKIIIMALGEHKAPVVRQAVKDRLLEELDYVQEADNQRLFAAYYSGHPFIRVPAVQAGCTEPAVVGQPHGVTPTK